MFARARKAFIAAFGAGASAALPILLDGGLTTETISKALGAFVAAAVLVGLATYRVANAKAGGDEVSSQR